MLAFHDADTDTDTDSPNTATILHPTHAISSRGVGVVDASFTLHTERCDLTMTTEHITRLLLLCTTQRLLHATGQ